MSEERLERIENQIGQLVRLVTTIHEDVTGLKQDVSGLKQDVSGLKQDVSGLKQDVSGLKQDMEATKQNVNALREDLIILRHRVDSIEGTIAIAIRSSHDSLLNYMDDLSYEISDNQRKTRLLNRRVRRLERRRDDEEED